MTLSEFLAAQRISYANFAARIGVAEAKTVERYAKGERMPRPAVMAAIVAATGGAVTANDFYPTTQGSPAPVGVDAAPSPRPSPTRGEGEESAPAAARRVAGGR